MNVRNRFLALALLATTSVFWLSGCDDKKETPNKPEQKKVVEHPPEHKK